MSKATSSRGVAFGLGLIASPGRRRKARQHCTLCQTFDPNCEACRNRYTPEELVEVTPPPGADIFKAIAEDARTIGSSHASFGAFNRFADALECRAMSLAELRELKEDVERCLKTGKRK
jgi:hypothetical protein